MRIASPINQILCCRLEYSRIILKVPNAMIASPAKQTTHFASGVIMVYSNRVFCAATGFHGITANRAFSLLSIPKGIKVLRRHLVISAKIARPCFVLRSFLLRVLSHVFLLITRYVFAIALGPSFLVSLDMLTVSFAPALNCGTLPLSYRAFFD